MIYRLFFILTLFGLQRLAFGQYSSQSVLNDGKLYRISTTADGVYKMDYTFLKDQLGVKIDDIDPRNIQLFGNGGGLIGENIDDPKVDDLQENHILVIGESDGRFDSGDYILFFGQAADQKVWNDIDQKFERPKNIYSDEVTYFLKIGDAIGLRIQSASSSDTPTYTSSICDSYFRLEEEKVNLLDDYNSASGTGQAWYGDLFKGIRNRSYTLPIPEIPFESEGHVKLAFASRSDRTMTLNASVQGQSFSKLIGGVNLSDVEGRYARVGIIEGMFTAGGNRIKVDIDYPMNSANSIGWLDYIEVNIPSELTWTRSTSPFSDKRSLVHTTSAFETSNLPNDLSIWDITDPHQTKAVPLINDNGNRSFSYSSDRLKTFIAFNSNSTLVPKPFGAMDNQNLHGIETVDMVVLYHNDLIDAAELFTSHRAQNSNLRIQMVDIDHVYNEFGSGAPSPVAIRNFAKMLYDRSNDFKYLLLLGDASFDFKNIKGLAAPSNLVPTYETKESLDPIRGFPSDDFYALLSAGEGSNLKGALDISVGRLPAKTGSEALDMVNKIIRYESNPNRFGEWRNKITFIADDEDFNIHLNQADQIASKLAKEHPFYNIEKIYLDAFKQVSTAGGELYPDVKDAINNSLSQGTNVINYMGHGGSTGFAQERILTINDVSNWTNSEKLALFVTATCSFTGYDDPNFVTAGERAILNPSGGAIALFTTVRSVYSSSNERLTRAVFDNLFKPVNGVIPPIGDILRTAKNSNAADTLGINARKFLLIGDPSLSLAKPRYQVNTLKINDQFVGNVNLLDTLKALTPITIEGQIEHDGSPISNFDGTVDILIFDKPKSVSTLGQDQTSFARKFDSQKNILFKGAASVSEGKFSFSFVVPEDIDYQFGNGKISYYAKSSENSDATGFFNDIVIGGTSDSPLMDDQGPEVELYLNDENFVSGGITGPNPTLLVNLKDDNGINIVGNSIGHDITAVIDNETSKTIILNDFYESELDNTKLGTIRFPLKNITEGLHSIEVKAWDIANNSTSSNIEFVVAIDNQSAIKRIINYPNPVIDRTSFLIDHNISGGLLDITIDIFTSNGKLVQSLKYNSGTNGGLIDNLTWDGNSANNMKLTAGVYLYKVTITDTNNSTDAIHSKLEKMVVLK